MSWWRRQKAASPEAPDREVVEGIGSALGTLWDGFDELFDSMPAEQWSAPFGPDWVFADVPHHLAAFDSQFIAAALEGRERRFELAAPADLDRWARDASARRPHDPSESLAAWRAARARIIAALETMSDADLQRMAWYPALWVRGERPLAVHLELLRVHTIQTALETEFRLGREDSFVDSATIAAFIQGYMGFLPLLANSDVAAGREFTAVWRITGPEGGMWTLTTAGGHAQLHPGDTPGADLEIVESADAYLRIATGVWNLVEAVADGRISVSDPEQFQHLLALLAPASPDIPTPVM